MAHFSEDEKLLKAFREGLDIHTWVASQAFDIPMEDVTKEMRDKAKAVGFGTIYGKTVYGFAKDWYSDQPDFMNEDGWIRKKYQKKAQEFLDRFFNAFPGVKKYINYTHAYCRKFEFVKTILGRLRRLPAINSDTDWKRSRAERQSVNSKIQGSAGDYIKLAGIELEDALEDYDSKQLLQVHDELVIEVPEHEDPEEIKEIVKDSMEDILPLKVEIIAEADIVDRWSFAK